MNIVDVKKNLHDEGVLSVIAHSVYRPTQEKLRIFADKHESDADISAFACDDDGFVCGTILVKRMDDETLEIMSIATEPACRKQGIASRLILFAIDALPCTEIRAETDDDAVGFYRKCGFAIESLGEKYPGVVRYLCTLKVLCDTGEKCRGKNS